MSLAEWLIFPIWFVRMMRHRSQQLAHNPLVNSNRSEDQYNMRDATGLFHIRGYPMWSRFSWRRPLDIRISWEGNSEPQFVGATNFDCLGVIIYRVRRWSATTHTKMQCGMQSHFCSCSSLVFHNLCQPEHLYPVHQQWTLVKHTVNQQLTSQWNYQLHAAIHI